MALSEASSLPSQAVVHGLKAALEMERGGCTPLSKTAVVLVFLWLQEKGGSYMNVNFRAGYLRLINYQNA